MKDEPVHVGKVLSERAAEMARGLAPEHDTHDLDHIRQEQRRDAWNLRIPSRFRWAHVADVEEPIAADLDEWARAETNTNLVLMGPVGVGKSHAAVAAARIRHYEHGQTVHFWPVVDLLDALRPAAPDEVADAVREAEAAPLLILDDLGAERPSDWTAERLYALVNRRWLHEQPTIVTTNLPAAQLQADERLISRLGHGALVLYLSGEDRRRDG